MKKQRPRQLNAFPRSQRQSVAGQGFKQGWSNLRGQLGRSHTLLSEVFPLTRFEWETITLFLFFPGKLLLWLVGNVEWAASLHTVNGLDDMFLASSFRGSLPLAARHHQIISYVNSHLAPSQRVAEGENETSSRPAACRSVGKEAA